MCAISTSPPSPLNRGISLLDHSGKLVEMFYVEIIITYLVNYLVVVKLFSTVDY